jgi:hypothetical protein
MSASSTVNPPVAGVLLAVALGDGLGEPVSVGCGVAVAVAVAAAVAVGRGESVAEGDGVAVGASVGVLVCGAFDGAAVDVGAGSAAAQAVIAARRTDAAARRTTMPVRLCQHWMRFGADEV